jgi:hypothetical protein
MCGSLGPLGLTPAERSASLWAQLRAGEVPDWLERIGDLPEQPFAVYRVRR